MPTPLHSTHAIQHCSIQIQFIYQQLFFPPLPPTPPSTPSLRGREKMESVFSLKKLFGVKIIQFVFKPKLSHILDFVINKTI